MHAKWSLRGTLALEYLGIAVVVWTTIALWGDDRITSPERVGLGFAVTGVALCMVLRRSFARRTADLIAAALLGAAAIATYKIGGLALLVGSLFMVIAALSATAPAPSGRRRIAIAVIVVAIPALGFGATSPGLAIALVPIALVMVLWAVWFLRAA